MALIILKWYDSSIVRDTHITRPTELGDTRTLTKNFCDECGSFNVTEHREAVGASLEDIGKFAASCVGGVLQVTLFALSVIFAIAFQPLAIITGILFLWSLNIDSDNIHLNVESWCTCDDCGFKFNDSGYRTREKRGLYKHIHGSMSPPNNDVHWECYSKGVLHRYVQKQPSIEEVRTADREKHFMVKNGMLIRIRIPLFSYEDPDYCKLVLE